LLDAVVMVAKDDLVDLVGRESSDLDRRVGQNQLLELDFELIEIPPSLLAEPEFEEMDMISMAWSKRMR
jgi:hypothetical protein